MIVDTPDALVPISLVVIYARDALLSAVETLPLRELPKVVLLQTLPLRDDPLLLLTFSTVFPSLEGIRRRVRTQHKHFLSSCLTA